MRRTGSFQHPSLPPPSIPSLQSFDSSSSSHSRHSITSQLTSQSPINHSHNGHPYHNYDNSDTGSPILLRDGNGNGMTNQQQHGGQMMSTGTKRAYRQRRKDPSCDACRERKVKCDATDTSSCTECTSRNVKCQFTKETNRRMSSIKQVQDLEKQLTLARAQIQQMKSLSRESSHEEMSDRGSIVNIPDFPSNPIQYSPYPPIPAVDGTRSHLRHYSKGVFKLPPPFRPTTGATEYTPIVPELPPRKTADALLSQYNMTIHTIYPILHWPSFVSKYESVYQKGDLAGVSTAWSSVFYAALALGVLLTMEHSGQESNETMAKIYIDISKQLTDPFEDNYSLDHVRCGLLTTIYLTEVNRTSAAWIHLGATVRIAQDIELHNDNSPWPPVEREMRRRVWWAVYIWDRLLSLELRRTLLIKDRECNTALPSPLDEHFLYDEDVHQPKESPIPTSNWLLTTISVARLITPLVKLLRTPTIPMPALVTLESNFASCLGNFPSLCQPNHTQSLDARSLSPILYLQNSRFILHRHNISPASSHEVRMDAIHACVDVARNTVRYLARVMLPQSHAWSHGIASAATTMICLHIWRCLHVLCFCGLWNEALTCVRACSAIGNTREVNRAIGRSLSGFLHVLGRKVSRNENLNADEGLLALLSGEAQGNSDTAWIWTGASSSLIDNDMNRFSSGTNDGDIDPDIMQDDLPKASGSNRLDDWQGWSHIEWMIQQIMNEQAARDLQTIGSGAIQLTQALPVPSPSSAPQPTPSQSGAARISIANII